MAAILGIDAAWTEDGSSGVALLKNDSSGWNCIAAERSYADFIGRAGLALQEDKGPLPDTIPNPDALLGAARKLLGGDKVEVVAVDIPVSTVPISGRRAADNKISSEFGANWCGTHSPSSERPGDVGTKISEGFSEVGYPLATADTPAGDKPKLIEVFPHVALLRMLGVSSRVPYKVGKSKKYWPQDTREPPKRAAPDRVRQDTRTVQTGNLRHLARTSDPHDGQVAGKPQALRGCHRRNRLCLGGNYLSREKGKTLRRPYRRNRVPDPRN